MKADASIINVLNNLLIAESTSIELYLNHYDFMKVRGYKDIADYYKELIEEERDHAHALRRLVFEYDSFPVYGKLNDFTPAYNLPLQLQAGAKIEQESIDMYNLAIELVTCCEHGQADNYIAEILQDIIEEEGEHLAEIEKMLNQITDQGLTNFLSARMG